MFIVIDLLHVGFMEIDLLLSIGFMVIELL